MDPDASRVARYHGARKSADAAKGDGRTSAGLKVCWSRDRDEAVRTVHRLWPNQFLPGELGQILPTPRHFEQAAELVTEETVSASAVCGNDVDEHVRALRAFADAGFDWVYISQIGPGQEGFFDFYRSEVLPRLPH